MKDASYKLSLLKIIQIFHLTGQTIVLCKQKLINPHSTGLDRELRVGGITYMCVPMRWDLPRPQRMVSEENFHK